MDFLARREHSFYELQKKLLIKFPEAPLSRVGDVLGRLREENLQSDNRFAEAYVRYRKSRGFGYQHIHSDLQSRHVDETVIDKYLRRDDETWETILNSLIGKRLEEGSVIEFGSSQHRKIVRFLESRGFEIARIRDVLKVRKR